MAQCYDVKSKQYVYCTSNLGAYIAVGVIVPISILIISLLLTACLRYRRRRFLRGQQHISMTTVVPIYNTDEQQQGPYNHPYPPHYTATASGLFDKPPSYEQSVQQLSETNNVYESSPAILPHTTVTSSTTNLVPPSRNQT